MKKILTMFLMAVMLLSLCACGGGGEAQTTVPAGSVPETAQPAAGLQVGFGRGDLTPTESVPLQGGANPAERMSEGIKTYLYALCIAVTDADGETAVIMSVDAATVGSYVQEMQQWIKSEYGIESDHFIISAIHQHSSPAPDINSVPSSKRYMTQAIDQMKKAITQAMEDRAPAEMYINTVQTEALNFVRRYIANDGSLVTDNSGDASSGLARHETDADSTMQLVKFVREGKKPIIVANFQAHPHNGYDSKDTHADWPYYMRAKVEKDLDAECMYISGAGGNVNSFSRISGEMSYDRSQLKTHGEKAAGYIIAAEDSYTKVNSGPVKAKSVKNEYGVDRAGIEYLADAMVVNNALSQSEAAAKEVLKNYPHLTSVYHAKYIVIRSELGETLPLTVGAISIGDVAFTFHQYEMYDQNGMELKAGTTDTEVTDFNDAAYADLQRYDNPYAMTVVCTLANGHEGYVPGSYAYASRGYTVDITRFAQGTAEQLVTDYLQILNELHG